MFTDQYDRKFSYLRLSVTDVCNFSCSYCLPDGYKCTKHAEPALSVDEIRLIIKGFAANGIKKIRLTGGEPSVRKDLTDIIEIAVNTPEIETVAITTNGYNLPKYIKNWHQAGLKALNISIDSLDPRLFHSITGHNRLAEVLKGMEMALELGLKVKLNAVLLKGLNHTQLPQFLDLVKNRSIALRFIELMQTGDNQDYFDKHHLSGQSIEQLLIRQKWQPQERSLTAGPAIEYSHPDYKGRIGLIMPYSKDFCTTCNRLRISSQGNLHLCLFASEGNQLRHLLQHDEQQPQLTQHIQKLLYGKKETHHLSEGYSGSTRNLSMLGG